MDKSEKGKPQRVNGAVEESGDVMMRRAQPIKAVRELDRDCEDANDVVGKLEAAESSSLQQSCIE